ncbi:hypothetical protein EYF80_054555 [Liparis tanakae]|uniref:Uncharacterized protein n=1 Tax=Liparis tanakae TaxID=230148 RepID=A0A4Z2F3D5_9TELE|nr:hypothetical protein EYF80_054555 [Liparis tanakae]TNN35282.1 hypothetical protein EYF80_054555 [Liparis tanakae]
MTNLRPHSFIKARRRTTERRSLQPAAQLHRYKQKRMERTVGDQDQTGTVIHIVIHIQMLMMKRLQTLLRLKPVVVSGKNLCQILDLKVLMGTMSGRSPGLLSLLHMPRNIRKLL